MANKRRVHDAEADAIYKDVMQRLLEQVYGRILGTLENKQNFTLYEKRLLSYMSAYEYTFGLAVRDPKMTFDSPNVALWFNMEEMKKALSTLESKGLVKKYANESSGGYGIRTETKYGLVGAGRELAAYAKETLKEYFNREIKERMWYDLDHAADPE